MKRIIRTFLAAAGLLTVGASAQGAYYACGGFQNWNPAEAVEFTLGDDGLYRLTIDFSGQDIYKVSTVRPAAGDSGTMWGEFDSGAVQTETTPALYVGASLVPGVDNMTAPAHRELTVVINPTINKLAYTDGQSEIDWDGITPDPESPWSGTLPVIFIDTKDAAPVNSKETYVSGTYYLDPMGVEGVEAVGSSEEPLPLKIKGRGNYTWTGFDKKPYRLKLDAKAGLLGLKKNKNFALMAHADDTHGFMRNTVGFEVSRRMGLEWTPGDKPVELVLNGQYLGLYFLTETIKVDKDRVAVYEQPDGDASTDVTGGWLVELDNYDTDPHVEFASEIDGYRLIFTYKTPEVLNSAQEEWLTNQMKAIDSAVAAQDKSRAHWLDYVDLDELVNFYLVQEVMDNYESFTGSCYLHRDIDDASLSLDGEASHKWKFGPVWDFGSTFFHEKTQFCYEGREHHMAWIGEMCKFPEFMDAVKARWNEFYPAQYGDMGAFIDNFADRITTAAKKDYNRWPQYGNSDMAFHAGDVKRRMENSVAWLNDQWGSASGIAQPGENLAFDAYVDGNVLVVKSPADTQLTLSRIDGTSLAVQLHEGRNRIALPAGLYIVAGRKLLIRQ